MLLCNTLVSLPSAEAVHRPENESEIVELHQLLLLVVLVLLLHEKLAEHALGDQHHALLPGCSDLVSLTKFVTRTLALHLRVLFVESRAIPDCLRITEHEPHCRKRVQSRAEVSQKTTLATSRFETLPAKKSRFCQTRAAVASELRCLPRKTICALSFSVSLISYVFPLTHRLRIGSMSSHGLRLVCQSEGLMTLTLRGITSGPHGLIHIISTALFTLSQLVVLVKRARTRTNGMRKQTIQWEIFYNCSCQMLAAARKR